MRLLRSGLRMARIAVILLWGAARIAVQRRDPQQVARETARRLLRALGVRLRVSGPVPSGGLVVCNHLGYLDILVLQSVESFVFVSKSDVRRWPVFGWYAQRMGCIFTERERPGRVGATNRQIGAALGRGDRVLLFPEGTSSGGETVLPFRSALLEPALGRPVSAAALAYALEPGDGDPSQVVCYWKDMTLLPHLLRLSGRRRIDAWLSFGAVDGAPSGRKQLATILGDRVRQLRAPIAEAAARTSGGAPAYGSEAAARCVQASARSVWPEAV